MFLQLFFLWMALGNGIHHFFFLSHLRKTLMNDDLKNYIRKLQKQWNKWEYFKKANNNFLFNIYLKFKYSLYFFCIVYLYLFLHTVPCLVNYEFRLILWIVLSYPIVHSSFVLSIVMSHVSDMEKLVLQLLMYLNIWLTLVYSQSSSFAVLRPLSCV